MPVDPNIIGNFKSFNDYQRLNDEFMQRKALQQAQIQQSQASAFKAMQPETITPYQAATLELQREQLNKKDEITPYQRESLDLQKQRMNALIAKGGMMVDDDGMVTQAPRIYKAMPASALKLQDEALQSLQIANGIKSDLGQIKTNLDTGKLDLGFISNNANAAKNYLGIGDERSRNYASFESTLAKLRNDSLRLNKGVQTEGDAVRAWDELIKNKNDKGVVSQRIDEIFNLNERAADLQRLRIDEIRNNFGASPYDYSTAETTTALKGGQPKVVSTKAQFDALPSGAIYIEDDGKTYRKP